MTLELSRDDGIRAVFDQFFDTCPNSLLIRGQPGTGKTTMALQLLQNYLDKYKGYYISTRVSLAKLTRQMPWVKDILGNESVLSVDDSRMHAITDVIPNDGPSQSSTTANPVTALAADVRLGAARNIVEKVLGASLKENALIILDSWDSLAKETSYEERIKTEKAMVAIADAHNSVVLFISEEPENSTVGYLVDGIVTTSFSNINGQRIRVLSIDKMRGTEIRQQNMMYTLKDSRIAFFPIQSPFQCKNPAMFEPLCPPPGFLSTGNSYFDKILGGGVKRGSIVLLEVDPDINRLSLALVLSGFVLNNLSIGNPAIVVSSPDRPYTSVLKYISPFCRKEDLARMVLFTYQKVSESDTPCVNGLGYDLSQNEKLFVCRYEEMKKTYGDDRPIILTYDLGMNELKSPDLSKLERKLVDGFRNVRANRDVEILINRTGMRSMVFSKIVSDVHLQLFEIEGVPLLRIIRPVPAGFPNTFAVVNDTDRYPSYSLVGLV